MLYQIKQKLIILWALYIKITKDYTLQHGIEKIYYHLVPEVHKSGWQFGRW